jgi:hypothetical protein
MSVNSPPPHHESRAKTDVWELASGIDALYISGKVEVPSRVLDQLQLAREVADAAEGPVGIEFGGVDFEILPRGLLKYRYRLEHEFGVIGITPGKALPAVRIQPRSEFLHRVGPDRAVDFFRSVLEAEMGVVALHASRLDLYIDIQGWDVQIDSRHRFVRRASKVGTHEDNDVFNGLVFGSRKTNTVYGRIYNKSAEIREKGGHYIEQTWGENYDPEIAVTRVEFQIGRQGLKEFGIDSVEEAIRSAPDLWVSLTRDWLSYRCEGSDTNKSRLPVAPEWIVVQNAQLANKAIGLKRMKLDRDSEDLWRLAAGLTGYAAQVTAIQGGRSIEDALTEIRFILESYEERSGKPFEERVAEKLGRRSFVIPAGLT